MQRGFAHFGVERAIGLELILIQDERHAARVNPDIEQQINLLDTIIENRSWLRDIAIPAFSVPVGVGDVKNIVPTVAKVVFGETVSRLETCITEIFWGVPPECLYHYAIRETFDNFALILDFRVAQCIQFHYRYHAYCSRTAKYQCKIFLSNMQIFGLWSVGAGEADDGWWGRLCRPRPCCLCIHTCCIGGTRATQASPPIRITTPAPTEQGVSKATPPETRITNPHIFVVLGGSV